MSHLCRYGPVLYGFSLAYLVAPDTFDSTHIVSFVSGLPEYVKYAGKAILAAPFAFHSLNGLRHLAWDSGKCKSLLFGPVLDVSLILFSVLTVKSAYRAGYAVIGATAISTVALVLM